MTTKKEPVDVTTLDRTVLRDAATAEFAERKAALAAGKPAPSTPAIDELTRRQSDMTARSTKKVGASTRSKGRTDIRYFHDGLSQPESHRHKLSTLAYFQSRGLDGDTPRVSTKEFVEVLKNLGVAEPGEPGWIVKLPNGITVECRLDGEKSQYDGPAHSRSKPAATPKAASKKPAATKPASKPRDPNTPAKSKRTTPAAKKRQVTPIPKATRSRKPSPPRNGAKVRSRAS